MLDEGEQNEGIDQRAFTGILRNHSRREGRERQAAPQMAQLQRHEAPGECSRLITEMESGDYVEPSKMTLADFFERWLRHIKPNVSPPTHERYTHIALKNIVPLLGSKILSKLAPIDISEAYPKAIESGRRDGKGGLSPRTVHHLHREFCSPRSIRPNGGR